MFGIFAEGVVATRARGNRFCMVQGILSFSVERIRSTSFYRSPVSPTTVFETARIRKCQCGIIISFWSEIYLICLPTVHVAKGVQSERVRRYEGNPARERERAVVSVGWTMIPWCESVERVVVARRSMGEGGTFIRTGLVDLGRYDDFRLGPASF